MTMGPKLYILHTPPGMWSYLLKGDYDGLASAEAGFTIPVQVTSPVEGRRDQDDSMKSLPLAAFHQFLVKVSRSSYQTDIMQPIYRSLPHRSLSFLPFNLESSSHARNSHRPKDNQTQH